MSASVADRPAGREQELEAVIDHSRHASGRALLVSSAPGSGGSAILRAACAEIFRAGGETVPVYFEFRPSDRTAEACAERFLREFLVQTVAFRRGEQRIAPASPGAAELEGIAPPSDEDWIGELSRANKSGSETTSAFVARAFGAPVRAAIHGVRCFVVFDGLENTLLIDGAESLPELISRIFSSGSVPFVIGGHTAFVAKLFNGGLPVAESSLLVVEAPGFEKAGEIAEAICDDLAIAVTEQARDLITTLLERNILFIRALAETAATRGENLLTFRDVLRTYYVSLMEGRLGGYFDTLIGRVAQPAVRGEVLELLGASVGPGGTRYSAWERRMSVEHGMEFLAAAGLVSVSGERVNAGSGGVLQDYVRARSAMIEGTKPEGKVLADLLRDGLKNAAGLMSAFYRSFHAIGVGDLLSSFDCQEVPLALLDYGLFRDKYKGVETGKLLELMREDLERIKLPQVFHAGSASELYPQLSELIEEDRAAVAYGFEHAEYDDENEIVWLAAEIDSKLEATEELTSFWCDRLEMAAVANEIQRYRIWLVAPEGFSPAAQELLRSRHAIGSSRPQAKMLRSYLASGELEDAAVIRETFSFVIPVGDDTELIVAHAVEDIARKAGYATQEVNQIKTALVEACINAAEHSLSPEGKINIEVAVESPDLTITVSNRGVRFSGRGEDKKVSSETRRGWGLQLIRSLMDKVLFETVDDGTKLTMAKALP